MPTDHAPGRIVLDDTVTDYFTTRDLQDGRPPLTGRVRPAMTQEITAYFKRRKDAAARSGEAEDKVRAEFYARHLKEWDAANPDGTPLPVTAAAVFALRYSVWLQLEDIVLGFAGADIVGKSDASPES